MRVPSPAPAWRGFFGERGFPDPSSMREGNESQNPHPCAKDAQGWGTLVGCLRDGRPARPRHAKPGAPRFHPLPGLRLRVEQGFQCVRENSCVVPTGLGHFAFLPRTYVRGFVLPPLRGWILRFSAHPVKHTLLALHSDCSVNDRLPPARHAASGARAGVPRGLKPARLLPSPAGLKACSTRS